MPDLRPAWPSVESGGMSLAAAAKRYLQLRPRFAPAIITALARMDGRSLGVIASQPMIDDGAIDEQAATKVGRMVELCDAYEVGDRGRWYWAGWLADGAFRCCGWRGRRPKPAGPTGSSRCGTRAPTTMLSHRPTTDAGSSASWLAPNDGSTGRRRSTPIDTW